MHETFKRYDTQLMEFLMKENDAPGLKVALFAKQPDGQPEVTADGYARRSMPLSSGDMKTLLLPEGDPDWGVVRLVVPMSFYSPPVKLTRWQRFKKFVQSIIFQWPVTIDRG